MEVESLGEAEGECIECEEQGTKFRSQPEEEGLMKGGTWRKTRMWQCQGSFEELSPMKRSNLCVHGSESFHSFGGFKFPMVLGTH